MPGCVKKVAVLLFVYTACFAYGALADVRVETDMASGTGRVSFSESRKGVHKVSFCLFYPGSSVNNDETMCWVDQRFSDGNGVTLFEFSLNGQAPSGEYRGIIKSEKKPKEDLLHFYYLNAAGRELLVREFNHSTRSGMYDFLLKYTTSHPVYQLPYSEEGALRVLADYLFENKAVSPAGAYQDTQRLIRLCAALIEINSAADLTGLNAALIKHSAVLELDTGADYTARYEKIGEKLLGLIGSSQGLRLYPDFLKSYNEIFALALVNSITDPVDITPVIVKYAAVFGIDVNEYRAYDQVKMNRAFINRNFADGISLYRAYEERKKELARSDKPEVVVGGGSGRPGGANSPAAVVPAFAAAEPFKTFFDDLGGYEWANDAVGWLAEKNIVSGTSDRRFSPSDGVKREEFVKMVVLSFGFYDSDASCAFEDVPAGAWYYGYVASAGKAGVVNGRSESLFGTGSVISREEMSAMLYRAAVSAGYAFGEGEPAFRDSGEISAYAREAVGRLSASGIIEGMGDGRFMPGQACIRAEAAKVLYQILNQGV